MDPGPYDEVLSNELYRIAFLDPDSPLNERVAEFLRVLRLTDLDMYHRLMQEVMWAQEEPKNMGAWSVMFRRLPELLPEGVELSYIGRPQRASPSEGYPAAHRSEQERIVLTALS